jgi:uncharacterized repeat protein (TIGR01451 family)
MKNSTFKIFFSGLFIGGLFFALTSLAAQPPVANAGPDLYVNSGQTITLQGSASDPNGHSFSCYWNCSGGTLSSTNITQPTYTPPSGSGQATFTCSLTVTNTSGLSNTDNMTIYVNHQQIGGASVQTNSATNISTTQAVLNGSLSIPYTTGTNYVWFQWGTTTSYGNETIRQNQNSQGSFNQNIANLTPYTTYHFRAVAQIGSNVTYGNDMTFYSSGSGSGSGILSVSKKVINLSSGNLNWQPSVNANPGDLLSFAITLQANSNQNINNVYVRDILPTNLIYRDNLLVNANQNYSGNPSSGINVGTIPANGVVVISYQAQVAPESNFSYGTTTLSNSATITSTEAGTQTVSAAAIINKTSVSGATIVDTGITDNFSRENFLIPLILIILMSWLYFTGRVYKFTNWLNAKIK